MKRFSTSFTRREMQIKIIPWYYFFIFQIIKEQNSVLERVRNRLTYYSMRTVSMTVNLAYLSKMYEPFVLAIYFLRITLQIITHWDK